MKRKIKINKKNKIKLGEKIIKNQEMIMIWINEIKEMKEKIIKKMKK